MIELLNNDLILNGIIYPVITAIFVSMLNKLTGYVIYHRRMKKYGGRTIKVRKDGVELGINNISIDETEMLLEFLFKKGNRGDISHTKTRQFIQSVVTGVNEKSSNLLSKFRMLEDGNFEINV